jgi:hypothetical protein
MSAPVQACAPDQQRRRAPALEWILLVTVIVIGIIGTVAKRSSAVSELVDLAEYGPGLNVKPEAEAEAEP